MQSQLLPFRIKPCLTAASFSQKELSYHKVTTINHALNLRSQWQNGKKWSNAFSISILRPIFTWETLNLWAALQPSTHWEISAGNGLVLRHLTRLCTGTGLEAVAQKVMILKHWKLVFLRKKVNEEIPQSISWRFNEFLGFSKRNRMNISKKHGHFHLPLRCENLRVGENHPVGTNAAHSNTFL